MFEHVGANVLSRSQVFCFQKVHLFVQLITLLQLQVISGIFLWRLLSLLFCRVGGSYKWHSAGIYLQLLCHLAIFGHTPVVSDGWEMPRLRRFHRTIVEGGCQIKSFLPKGRNGNIRRLLVRGNVSKLFLNGFHGLGRVNISHQVQQNIVRSVVRPVPGAHVIIFPIANEHFLANGKAFGQSVLSVQSAQNLAFDAIFNRIDHCHFTQNGRPFFFQSRRFHAGFHDILQGIQGHGQHGHIASGCHDGARRVKHRVMKIRVGIGLRARSKQSFSLATAHVRDMLRQVGNSLLGFQFVGAAREYLQMGFKASGR
mmetsp:Transcript_5615/g.11571  ORF Transcript_5615/g.11571 Transcript_5615/m.11571 type:complete len:312 (-) Transcript_5615:719-1654(-)